MGNKFNIGSVHYMFNLKLDKKRHRYCILPPTVWKLFNYMHVTYEKENKKDLFNIIDNGDIENFHSFLTKNEPDIDKNSSEFDKKLMHLYYKMGSLSEIIKKIKPCVQDNERLRRNLSILEAMLAKDVIEPIDKFVDLSLVKIDKKTYNKALSNLNVYRPDGDINNKINALNVAITNDLTEQCLSIYDSNQPAFFRLISNADSTLDALRDIGVKKEFTVAKEEKTLISCCPQFLSYILWFEREIIGDVELSKRKEFINEHIEYLDKHIPHIEEIKHNYVDVQSAKKFITSLYCGNDVNSEKTLEIMQNYLTSLDEIKEIYKTYVEPNVEINLCIKDYFKNGQTYGEQKTIDDLKQSKSLTRLLKQLNDEKTDVEAAFEVFYAEVKVTYEYLRKCVTNIKK
jgi:hypothetical protein